MESTSPTPDPARGPAPQGDASSAARQADAAAGGPGSAVARALPTVDPTDETPTIISLHRPRAIPGEAIEALQGKKLGHFELIEPIGVGGMAAVIRATDLQLGRVVALKILPPEM